MTPRLQLSQFVINRLGRVKTNREGAVYGTMYNNSLLVVGLSVDDKENGTGAAPYQQLQTHFPTEIDFCGVVIFTEHIDDQLPPTTLDILNEVLVTDNPLVMKRAITSGELQAFFYCNQKLVEVEYEVLSEADICQRFVHVRLCTHLPLVCDPEPASILEAINNLQKTVSSGTVAFHVNKTQVYLFGTEMEDSSSVGQLFESVLSPEDKKKPPNKLKNIEVLNVSMMQKATRDGLSEDTSRLAPVIHHIKCNKQSMQVELPIDHLALVHMERRLAELYNVLVDTLCRSLRIFERCLSHGHKKLSLPKAHHFLPPMLGHYFTLIYLSKTPDSDLDRKRESLHRQFNLNHDRPVFRRGNTHMFREDIPSNAPLVNPHEGLSSAVHGGQVSMVYGRYSYHHYLQGGAQDDGWGCAYRSLQTIISWYKHQGYTNRNVPSHKDIQACLVTIGDKPSSFLGSRQWIGSTEVSYCLDAMLAVTCRIINLSTGAEMAEVGPALARHFDTQGTPVMIGGGVLAHTILGVDLNRESGEVRFLVLDPHYTGSEDLRTVQQKGWVAWKKPDFWNKAVYYNLCLPFRPVCF